MGFLKNTQGCREQKKVENYRHRQYIIENNFKIIINYTLSKIKASLEVVCTVAKVNMANVVILGVANIFTTVIKQKSGANCIKTDANFLNTITNIFNNTIHLSQNPHKIMAYLI